MFDLHLIILLVRSLDKCPTPEVTNKAFAQISIEIVCKFISIKILSAIPKRL